VGNGSLYAWGDNNYGQLGLGDNIHRKSVPTQIGSYTDWEMVACGDLHNAGLRNGSLYAWGYNTYGQLGLGHTNRKTPTQVGSYTDWKMVACGTNHTLAIKEV